MTDSPLDRRPDSRPRFPSHVVGPRQQYAFAALHYAPGSTAAEVAKNARVSASTASAALRQLEKDGHAIRTRRPKDAAVWILKMTLAEFHDDRQAWS